MSKIGGNLSGPPYDYLGMDCDEAREALSAVIDNEVPGVQASALQSHLDHCPSCTAWYDALRSNPSAVSGAAAPDGDVLPSVLAAMASERAAIAERAARRALVPWRVGLALVAVIQPLLVLPSLVAGHWLDHAHDARELGSWHLALAVGFAFAACRPARAWGMLPLVAALVFGLLVTAGVDIADGEVGLVKELAHAVDAAGLACLWAVSARVQRPARRLSLA